MTTTEAALRSFRFLGNEAIVHLDSSDTKGAFAVLEMRSVPGAEPPMHIHENEDEFFIVLEGRMKVICGGIETELSAGESAVAQRGTPHTFKILSPELRSLAILSPAGFEEFFRALANVERPSVKQIAHAAARFGSRLNLDGTAL
jgi:mannose-6-phosphate isomerase-like protein (cupin superfamily)